MKIVKEYEIEDTGSVSSAASDNAVQRFRDASFGLMMHWGLYALHPAKNEWVYFRDRIPFDVYRERMAQFNPSRFDAEEWADLMLESEQKFLLITSKHHDGFCLWDTKDTDFQVMNTPFKRDILAELSEALSKRGLSLHFYYSLVDWTNPAFRNDWPAYVEFYQNQIRELCMNYGEIGGFFFDGYWPRTLMEGDEDDYFSARGKWDLAGTYDIIHSLQPDAAITNNHHILPLKGEDYQVWELDMPGENTIGFNTTEIGDLQRAVCWNLNAGWSYQPYRHAMKSPEMILETYRKCKEKDAVFMLNVGPRPYGDIHPDEQHTLRQIGRALREGH